LYAPEGLSFRYDVSIMLSLLTAAAALAWFVKKQYFTKKILSPLD
jgi:NADPH:quinone reductase-like Zn-dependent oxidoreductase